MSGTDSGPAAGRLQMGRPAVQLGADALLRGEESLQGQGRGLGHDEFGAEPAGVVAVEMTDDGGDLVEPFQKRSGAGSASEALKMRYHMDLSSVHSG